MNRVKIISVLVLDQDAAIEFYTRKLGFEVLEARLAGVSLRWVNRIVEEAPGVHVDDDAAEREKRRVVRPSKVQGFRNLLVEFLEEKPDLTSLRYARFSPAFISDSEVSASRRLR
jgi:catechol 2,3-dioxygenase-like lactoylglutathione lyase family enzyme